MASKARWYKFSEDSADIGKDSSTHKKDLTNFGVTSVTDPTYGKVAYFNGQSYLKLASSQIPTSMTSDNSRSLSLWMKPEGSAGGLVTYGNKVSNRHFGKRYAVNYAGGSGPIEILLFNILPTRTVSGVITTNQWNHVAVIFDGATDNSQIYINGNLAISNTKKVDTASGHDLYVGWYQEGGDHFVGRMVDMRFYASALGSASIVDMYNDGPATVVPEKIEFIERLTHASSSISFQVHGYPTSTYDVVVDNRAISNVKSGETVNVSGLNAGTTYTVSLLGQEPLTKTIIVRNYQSNPLSLAEVEVIDISGSNVAVNGTATQSSTAFSGVAHRGIDGNKSGFYLHGGMTHTSATESQWWRLVLDTPTEVDRVVVWNRTEASLGGRLSGATIEIYDQFGDMQSKATLRSQQSQVIQL